MVRTVQASPRTRPAAAINGLSMPPRGHQRYATRVPIARASGAQPVFLHEKITFPLLSSVRTSR
jgi:hypothetical protein